jgi:G:T-mismatch repair DNA endonuclease (very short patch repair protein)
MTREEWDRYKDLEYYPDRVCGCGCGGKIRVKPSHKWCGIPKYLPGHQNKTEEGRKKQREAKLGDKNPAKNPKVGIKISIAKIKYKKETRICKYSKCNATFEVPTYSNKKYHCHKCSTDDNRNKPKSEESNEKRRKTHKQLWQDPEFVRKKMKANNVRPNKPEKFLTKLFQELYPNEWKYVGDGQFILAGKCPDFVNINGQKKIIELYGDYWHKDDNPQDRIDLFAKYGYQTLVIWEHELEDVENLKEKLVSFNRS